MSTQSTPKYRWIYKALGLALIAYALVAGLGIDRPGLTEKFGGESWRNIFFHVPMWYAMMIMFFYSAYHSIQYLNKSSLQSDSNAANGAHAGILFGILGLVTGVLWSRVTWVREIEGGDFQAWWAGDPKQNAALVLVLIYLGYFLVRSTIAEPTQRAKVSAVLNVFGAAMIVPLLYIVPKVATFSSHPGSGEEGVLAALKSLDAGQRMVFYPAALGFILLGVWLVELRSRIAAANEAIEEKLENNNE